MNTIRKRFAQYSALRFFSTVKFTVYPEGLKSTHSVTVSSNEGANLMEVLTEADKSIEEFGLCGKELSCHTCRVNITKGFDALPAATVDEEDVFDQLGKDYKKNQTRMSCQILVSKSLEGCEIEIPREAYK